MRQAGIGRAPVAHPGMTTVQRMGGCTPSGRTRAVVRGRLFLDQIHLADGLAAPVGDAYARWDGGQVKQWFAEFQTQATVAFHRRTRNALDAYAGRRVPFSCNNGVRTWGAIERGFDWAFGELSYGHASPAYLHAAMRRAASRCA